MTARMHAIMSLRRVQAASVLLRTIDRISGLPSQHQARSQTQRRPVCFPADSIVAMKARGLEVLTPDAKTSADFRAAATKLNTSMRGQMVPADIYDMAVATRDAFRKSKGK